MLHTIDKQAHRKTPGMLKSHVLWGLAMDRNKQCSNILNV